MTIHKDKYKCPPVYLLVQHLSIMFLSSPVHVDYTPKPSCHIRRGQQCNTYFLRFPKLTSSVREAKVISIKSNRRLYLIKFIVALISMNPKGSGLGSGSGSRLGEEKRVTHTLIRQVCYRVATKP